MKLRLVVTSIVAVVALAALGALGTWRLARATGPDVNNDGHVRIDDIVEGIHHYFEDVPTPMPLVTAVTMLGSPLNIETGRPWPHSLSSLVALSSLDYPPGTSIRLDAVWIYQPYSQACIGLVDEIGEQVPGSRVCAALNASGLVQTGPFQLLPGAHVYDLQVSVT